MWTINKISLTAYTNGSIKLEGSVLDGLNVLAWQPPNGRHLVWLDELGKLNTKAVAGFLVLAFKDVAERSEEVARRAILTNSDDIAKTLEEWAAIDAGKLPPLSALHAPELVYLGIARRKNYRMDDEDVGLPKWSWGYMIVEVEEPVGFFAALGYCRCGEDEQFKVAKKYYVPLLVEPEAVNR